MEITKQARVRGLLRKHWLLLSAATLGLLLLGALALGSVRRFQATTPIASIAPEQPEKGNQPSSRLERYKKEMEELNRQQARRQRSMETIVSMDFGSMSPEEAPQAVAPEPIAVEQEPPSLPERSPVPGAGEQPPVPVSQPTRAQPRERRIPSSAEAAPTQTDPFNTVRANEANGEQHQTEKKAFYSALVHGDQKLLPNATLSLRLQEEMVVGTHRFPRNTLIYGKLSGRGGGRLKVRILSIASLPVRMSVYDQDYQEGLAYLQEEPLPSALAESRDDALNDLLYAVPYGGVASGLAGLGRNVLRKSRRGKPVFLADGYPVFIAIDSITP